MPRSYKKRMGSGGVLHICGKTKAHLGRHGCDRHWWLKLDNQDDIGELRTKHEGTVTVIGNVDPVSVMKYGKKEDIYEAVKCAVIRRLEAVRVLFWQQDVTFLLGHP